MDLLENPVHRDAWGSPDAIPDLLGLPSDGEPQSELWVGAHPSAPSVVRRGGTAHALDALIAADPAGELGARSVSAYGPRLPFLLKVLAASRPLSLQAHPTLAQAEAGFAAEDALGVARDAPERSYPDANHKPELVCALTRFEALCGFREVSATVELLQSLALDELGPDVDTLLVEPSAAALRTVLQRWFGLGDDTRRALVSGVALRCAELVEDVRWGAETGTVVELAAEYPGDIGVVASLLLNRVTLEPGQAVFIAAGHLHAYLRGVAVEVMASSDNVLRAGLTRRPVDHVELLRVLGAEAGPVPYVLPEQVDEVELRYPVPVPDFALSRLELRGGTPYELRSGDAQVLLVVDGAVVATQGAHRLPVARGQALYVPVRDHGVRLDGTGTVFRATSSSSGAAGWSRPT